MLTLPIPLFVALVLAFLALRHAIAQDRSPIFLILLAACATQALLISLTQHYGLTFLLHLQPVTAVAVPPLAWLTFQSAALRPLDPHRDALHLLVPVFTAFCEFFAPVTLDMVVPVVFLSYGAAILIRLNRDDTLPLARLEAGPLPVRVWKAIAILLILSALADVLIVLALTLGREDLRPMIISVFTSVTLLGIGLVSMSRDASGTADSDPAPPVPDPNLIEEDAALMARLDALMVQDRLYLDADLTLTRLARRLHVPIKQLSAAINRTKGENVSRYVNGYRIDNACEHLISGTNVTEAMLNSGFNTKSNFNREFVRVTGQSPSAFLQSRAQAGTTG
ncbi:helix-turn-helix domain-containing protein [Paracoccus tegillarcae]|uniref:AraC family transcriptional regulator n=1 Tax=Paracoccus tegillarcae TaxID=1529068 RepID=A0A2K9EC85_9RHOB|nr:helix-turn-helix domain-containing protein [Paracoccus tegillarcae]AUH32533.1 AraC family transcriptional regulator [Paracoccus tegillarcae]